MTSQLRMYTIQEGRLQEFVEAWQKGVYPLRLAMGFTIDGAWACEERQEFMWVLSYDGPLNWDDANDAYYSSPERAALRPDPAELITQIRTCFVRSALPDGRYR